MIVRGSRPIAILMALVLGFSSGCAGTRNWRGSEESGSIEEFLTPKLVGENVRMETPQGTATGRLAALDLQSGELLLVSPPSAFDEADSVFFTFGEIESISVSNHRVADRRFLLVVASYLALVYALYYFVFRGFEDLDHLR